MAIESHQLISVAWRKWSSKNNQYGAKASVMKENGVIMASKNNGNENVNSGVIMAA